MFFYILTTKMKQSLSILKTESVTKRLNGDKFLIDALYRIYPKQIRNYMQDIEESMQNEIFFKLRQILIV